MKWARVENGMVMEVIEFNPAGRFHEDVEKQFIKCSDNTEQRDLFDGSTFTKPTPIPVDNTLPLKIRLDELDKQSIRDAEDLYSILIQKNILSTSDVPYISKRVEEKKVIRKKLNELEGRS